MSKRDDELNEELRAHVQMAARDRVARGESAEDAERNARRELGNELLIKETTRDMWGWASMDRLARDLRYVGRQMRRSPGFTSVAVLTLALGLGATTAMFSIVNGVLLEPLKFREPGRLYVVQNVVPIQYRAQHVGNFPVNARHYGLWRDHCESCEDISMAGSISFTLTGSDEAVNVPGMRVSYNFFRTLGVQPAMGRDFLPEEEMPGHFHEVILTDGLWRSRFEADPAIVGRVIQVSGEPYTVVGVLPADLHLPSGGQWGVNFATPVAAEMFRPFGMNFSTESPAGSNNYLSVVRLKAGATPEATAEELNAVIADLVRQYHIELKPTLFPLRDMVTMNARSALWLLLGTVGMVLLIVCVNIGNLMLVRTAGRYREAGVRMALGASRGDLFRLVFLEALAMAVAGGLAGLMLAEAALRVFVAMAPVALPRIDEVGMDARVFGFACAATLLSVLIAGLLPAWNLARTEPQESLKAGSASVTASGGKLRLREILVGVEVALSTVLLIAGGLLMLSFSRVMRVNTGFETAHVIEQDVSLAGPAFGPDAPRARYIEEALRRLGAIPGVTAAGVTNQIPLKGDTWIDELREAGRPQPAVPTLANFRFVNGDYWKAMGIPVKAGRVFEERDRARKVAVIDERSAKLLWPEESALGKHVHLSGSMDPAAEGEVIGVVGEARSALERESPHIVYSPYWTNTPRGPTFVVRTAADPAGVMGAVRLALRQVNAGVPVSESKTMERVAEESVEVRRFQMNLALAFAAAALLLASLGIYGVISYTVARRTSEMGIRIALGAPAGRMVGMVLRQGMVPVIAGLGVGVGCALGLGRFLAGELYGVGPRDPLTLCGVVGLLLVVAAGACWAPARRAARIDPLRALRAE